MENLSIIDVNKPEKVKDALNELINYKNNAQEIPTITAETLGIGNVENTADMDKPLSSAQKEYIDEENNKNVKLSSESKQTIKSDVEIDEGYKFYLKRGNGDAESIVNITNEVYEQVKLGSLNIPLKLLHSQVDSSNFEIGKNPIVIVRDTDGNEVEEQVAFLSDVEKSNSLPAEIVTKINGIEDGAEKNVVRSVNSKQGDVVLNAEDVGALPKGTFIPVVIDDLVSNEMSSSLSAKQGKVLNEKIETEKERTTVLEDNVSNPNLLINGDFRVNQRGQTSYTSSTGTRVYCVDRWALSKASFNNTTKTLTISSQYGNIAQSIENPENLIGKTITASCKVSNIQNAGCYLSIVARDINSTNLVTSYIPLSNGVTTSTIEVQENTTSINVSLIKTYADTTQHDIVIDYVKLEVGSVATAFSPRPYAEELLMCQRYYQHIRLHSSSIPATNTTYLYPSISTIVTMRTKPTMVNIVTPQIRGYGIQIQSSNVNITQILQYYDNLIIPEIQTTGLTQYQSYALFNGAFDLDAEIY